VADARRGRGVAGVTPSRRTGAGARTRAARNARGREPRARAEPERDAEGASGVEDLRGEPEPEWAQAIRRGRDERAARLRTVFASFDEASSAGGAAAPDADEVPDPEDGPDEADPDDEERDRP
jgi:hypothetical protein